MTLASRARCRRRALAAGAVAALLVAGCGRMGRPADEAPTTWFDDVSQELGIDFEQVRGRTPRHWLPEIIGGGACFFDYDGDGWLDLYLVQSADAAGAADAKLHNVLYRNRAGEGFDDVTATAGGGDTGIGMGCACGDYDGDGDLDLYVTNLGRNTLYRNDRGRLSDVTVEAGVGDTGWGTSAAFFDADGDGDLDLFVVNYIRWSPQVEAGCFTAAAAEYCSPQSYRAPAPAVLYRNDGGGRFTDVSREAGLHTAYGNGLGLVVADLDRDGRLDVYVVNDGNPNQLWIAQGDGRFEDRALFAGCAVNGHGAAQAGMGVAVADLGDDGALDLFITHLYGESNTLYRQQEDGASFIDATPDFGLAAPSLGWTGFGTGFADFDHDGRLDLLVANGGVSRLAQAQLAEDPYAQPDHLYQGQADGRFALVEGAIHAPIASGRAAAFADFDEDGDVDVCVVNNGGRAQLLRNRRGSAGGHWAKFRVLDGHGLDAIGATVAIETSAGVQRRLVQVAYSYCASNDPRVHFGLGAMDRIERVTVAWPRGGIESFGALAVDRVHVLRQGGGAPAGPVAPGSP